MAKQANPSKYVPKALRVLFAFSSEVPKDPGAGNQILRFVHHPIHVKEEQQRKAALLASGFLMALG